MSDPQKQSDRERAESLARDLELPHAQCGDSCTQKSLTIDDLAEALATARREGEATGRAENERLREKMDHAIFLATKGTAKIWPDKALKAVVEVLQKTLAAKEPSGS